MQPRWKIIMVDYVQTQRLGSFEWLSSAGPENNNPSGTNFLQSSLYSCGTVHRPAAAFPPRWIPVRFVTECTCTSFRLLRWSKKKVESLVLAPQEFCLFNAIFIYQWNCWLFSPKICWTQFSMSYTESTLRSISYIIIKIIQTLLVQTYFYFTFSLHWHSKYSEQLVQ